MERYEKVYVYFCLSVFLICSAVFGFWLVYPYKVMTLNSITVEPNVIKKGTTLVYKVDYCKYINLPATTSRQL
ncbi:hypothetical protein U2075_14735, partial [Listeria monocytogenes]|uniref:hypothetical protein n=1 Tax=Listeria monocytogenes TaxID=1639 RepID=UPI002FDC5D7C